MLLKYVFHEWASGQSGKDPCETLCCTKSCVVIPIVNLRSRELTTVGEELLMKLAALLPSTQVLFPLRQREKRDWLASERVDLEIIVSVRLLRAQASLHQ